MYQKCELYAYEGLYLDEEEITKLNIQKTNSIGLVALLQNTNCVFEMNANGYFNANKEMLQVNAMKGNKEICYIMRNGILIVLPFKILYGVKNDKQIIAFWNNEKVRDAKFLDIKRNGVSSIIFEMSSSQPIVDQYEKQLKLRKIYNNLHI